MFSVAARGGEAGCSAGGVAADGVTLRLAEVNPKKSAA